MTKSKEERERVSGGGGGGGGSGGSASNILACNSTPTLQPRFLFSPY